MDFNRNPLLKKALADEITYTAFKQIATSGSSCSDALNNESTEVKIDDATLTVLKGNLEKLMANGMIQ